MGQINTCLNFWEILLRTGSCILFSLLCCALSVAKTLRQKRDRWASKTEHWTSPWCIRHGLHAQKWTREYFVVCHSHRSSHWNGTWMFNGLCPGWWLDISVSATVCDLVQQEYYHRPHVHQSSWITIDVLFGIIRAVVLWLWLGVLSEVSQVAKSEVRRLDTAHFTQKFSS